MDRRVFVGMMGAGMVSAVFGEPGAADAASRVRFILCLLGPGNWLARAQRCVDAFGRGFWMDRDYSREESDDRMKTSFGVSWNRVPATYADSDLEAIEAHQSLVYVLSQDVLPASAMSMAGDALELIEALFDAGALACKCETGGVANGVAHWRSSARRFRNADQSERAGILYRAFVRRPLDDDGVLYTAGMHCLGVPDIDYLGPLDLLAATARIDAVARSVLAGDTRGLTHAPCERYSADEFLYNPHGVLRLDER